MLLEMDLLNEIATILLTDISFIFTPLEPSSSLQYKFGYLFLAIVILTVLTQIFFLISGSMSAIKIQYFLLR